MRGTDAWGTAYRPTTQQIAPFLAAADLSPPFPPTSLQWRLPRLAEPGRDDSVEMADLRFEMALLTCSYPGRDSCGEPVRMRERFLRLARKPSPLKRRATTSALPGIGE
jgi:hypothetical protein